MYGTLHFIKKSTGCFGKKSFLGLFVVGSLVACSEAQVTETIADPGLIPYVIVNGSSIDHALTDVPGDAKKGRALAINRKKGNCLACHALPIPEQSFHGEVATSLYGVGNRLSAGELRMQIVNPKVTDPDTIMPAFYRTSGFNRVKKNFIGKSILKAQEVEDIIAYLLTLKEEQ